jgi:hydroxymethylpyrimidine pyrophosphatase-like HAD family hydrolase
MKPIDELKDISNINLVVFDVDGVIVPRGTEIIEVGSKVTFNLKFPSKEFIETAKGLLKYTNVAISSGRSMLTLKTIFTELFGQEENGHKFILQAENGGRISIGADEIGAGHNSEFIKGLSSLRSKLREVKHENIKGFEPKETILTVHAHNRVPGIEKIVDKNTHYIIWNGEAYDIGDPSISKGTGLTRIKQVLKEGMGGKIKAIAIGDRQNDLDLLENADISVSADPEVLRQADYFISEDSKDLPGVILAKYLLKKFKEKN